MTIKGATGMMIGNEHKKDKEMWREGLLINEQRGNGEYQESMPRDEAIKMWWKRMRLCDRNAFNYLQIRKYIKHLIRIERFSRKFHHPSIILVINNRIFAVFPQPDEGNLHFRINYIKTKFFMWRRRKGD